MKQFLILANDYTDEGAMQRRLQVRNEHLERMRLEKAKGRFIIGGAKLDNNGKMIGSMLVAELPDEDAVHLWLKDDPYVKGSVWEHIEIVPFKVARV